MCKQHALRIAWTIARSIAFLDFRVLRWKFTYDWKCVNTTYRVPLFMPTACFPEASLYVLLFLEKEAEIGGRDSEFKISSLTGQLS